MTNQNLNCMNIPFLQDTQHDLDYNSLKTIRNLVHKLIFKRNIYVISLRTSNNNKVINYSAYL